MSAMMDQCGVLLLLSLALHLVNSSFMVCCTLEPSTENLWLNGFGRNDIHIPLQTWWPPISLLSRALSHNTLHTDACLSSFPFFLLPIESMHCFTYLFNSKDSLYSHYMPGTVLGFKDRAQKKTTKAAVEFSLIPTTISLIYPTIASHPYQWNRPLPDPSVCFTLFCIVSYAK